MIKLIIAGIALGFVTTATKPLRAPAPTDHPGHCGSLETDAGCYSIPTLEGGWLCICPPVIVANPGPCPDYDDCSV